MGERERDQHDDGAADKPATGRRRVGVHEAASILGLTVEAIRGRIKRGTIDHERDGERVFVLVDTDKPPTGHSQSSDGPSDQPTDQNPAEDVHARELVEQMRDQIDDLRRRLDQAEEARRRADTIIMQLTQTNATLAARVPELEAAPAQETPQATETGPEGASPRSGMVGAQEGAQEHSNLFERPTEETARRPWWVRVFGDKR